MSSGPKQPKPVDPETVAAAQARWNRTGTISPFGSVTWQGNNQVVTPSDAMMGLFGRAQDLAMQDSERFQTPGNFGSIRDQIMSRLQANQYGLNAPQPGAQPDQPPPADLTGGDMSLAKGTPIRDAFFGERQNDGSRHTFRHIARGGLMGAIPRAIGNVIDEHRANQMPGPIGIAAPDNSPIERNGLGGLLGAMGTAPRRDRGMPGPIALPNPGGKPPIERTRNDKPGKPTLSPTRGLGRKPTAREIAAMRQDPSSLLGPQGADAMSPLFTSQTRGLFDAYDLQNSPGAAFDAAVAAYRLAQRPNRNIQQ